MEPIRRGGFARYHEGKTEMEVKVSTLKELKFYWMLPYKNTAYY